MPNAPVLHSTAIEAYDHLSLPVWVFSIKSLRILWANQAAQVWIGYDLSTLQTMKVADLRPDADRGRIVEKVREFDGSKADAGTWTIISKSGDHYSASFTWSRVFFQGAEAIVASIRDITGIAQAEAHAEAMNHENAKLRRSIRLSEAHLASLFDSLPGKMLVLTPVEYRIMAVTDEYAQAVMCQPNALLNKRLFDVFPDDPSEPEADGVRNLRSSLKRVESLRAPDVMNLQRYPVRRPDGTFEERFWLPRNKPVLDDNGHVIYIIHRVEEVTEILAGKGPNAEHPPERPILDLLQLAETRTALLALKERETRLKMAETLLDLGAWEYEFERDQLNWSDKVFEICGIPRDLKAPDFVGYVALLHPEDRKQMLADCTRFFETGALEIEFQHRVIRSDGTVVHIRGAGARHQVDGRQIVIGFIQDITAVKLAEERLMREARRRRLAGHLARLGSWRVDFRSRNITWDAETAAIHDEPEENPPTLERAIAYYIPKHRERIRAHFEACATEGRPFRDTLQIETSKNRRVWVHVLGEPVRNESGEIVAVEGAFQDITDLITVQNEAAELSARLRRTVESMNDAFFLLDNSWKFVFLNSQAEKLLRRNNVDLAGKNIWREFPEAAGSSFQREYERALTEGHAVRFQEYYRPLEKWFEVSAHPTPEGLAVYFRDITLQHTRDVQLRLLEAAVSRQNDILLITDAEPIEGPAGPKIVYVNDAFERLTGFSREEVIGQTPRILQGTKTDRAELDRIRSAMEKWRPVRSELINYTKSGEEFWLELDIVPLADEKGYYSHWIAVQRDITTRKMADLALQANEERFRLIARAAGSAIWDWNVTTGQQWWSEGLRHIFGHEVDPSGLASTDWRTLVHPDDLARVDLHFQRLASGQNASRRLEYRFRRGDGSWATVEDKAFVLYGDDGKVRRILGSITDISEQKVLEERLRQAQRMEAVGQLTGGVAHDFNNLLTIILGNADILDEELSELPHLQRLAQMTLDAADRGAELTNRLLAFSRKQPLEPKVLDIGQLVRGMEGLLRRTLPEHIDIHIVKPDDLWQIEADAAQLESAVLNLALNARDAMPDGGSLTIAMANTCLEEDDVGTEPGVNAGQYVVVVVSDTGSGMSPEVISRVFEPFYTTKEVGKGSGLGLSMVYGFIKQSGGSIQVISEQGEGTTIKMHFPRSRANQALNERGSTQREIAAGTETILVVEDDVAVREFVTAQLRSFGYRVLEASTGSVALAVLSQTPEIDLLLTDVIMPGGMGGRDLAEAARKIRPSIKVLFTSGYTENTIIHQGRLDPGIKLLSKPYRRDQLASMVNEVLREGG